MTHLSLDDLRKVDQMTEAMTHPLEEENRRLREALRRYEDDFCEGWCKENGGTFSDCSGCIARAALAAEPASGEAEDRAQDAMRAQVYPALWPGPSLGAAPPPPPTPAMTQGEEERARAIVRHHANRNSNRLTFPLSFDDLIAEIAAALRQRADEATREEREACAKIADSFTCGLCGMDGKSAAAIRARIKP